MTWARISWGKVCKTLLLCFLLVLLGFSVLLWYITTDSFQQLARRRLVAAIERSSGGRAELGSFRAVPLRLQVEVRDLTIHGKEAPGEPPYAHVDRLTAVLNLSSALGAKVAFHSLTLEHPVIHVIFYPDGSTNQPTNPGASSSDFRQLFSLSTRQLQVRKGELLLQDKRIPLEFSSNDVSANLGYSFLHRRYTGNVATGKVETHFDGVRPVAWAGQATFTFDREGLQVQSLTATAENSQLRASGVHVDFRKLTVKGNYDLNLDLAKVGLVFHRPQVKAGMLHVTGNGSWSREGFVAEGDFGLRAMDWQHNIFSGRELSGGGKFFIDPRRLAISKAQGQFLHGTFVADAEVVNWQSPAVARNLQQRGVVVIKTKNFSLTELLGDLGPNLRPMNKLKFAGNVSGSAEVQWKQSINYARANVVAEISPASSPHTRQVPLTANVRANYDFRSDDMQLSELTASTAATQLHAYGTLASSVKIAFSSNDLQEWQPLIAQLFPAGAPLVVHGHAAFNGTAAGRSSNFRLAGNLQLRDFDAIVRASAGMPERQVHWDLLNADVQASATSLSLRNAGLRREDATVKINGTAGLDGWSLVPESPLRLRVDVQNANADELGNFAGYDHQFSGKLSAALQLSGTRRYPEGHGNISLSNGSIRGQTYDSANANLTVKGTQLTVTDVTFTRAQARVAGSGEYDLAVRSFQFKVHGTNFDLADVDFLERSKVKITGKLDFTAQAFGTTTAPEVTAELHFRNVALNDHPEGDFLLNAVSRGTDVRLTGHSDFKDAELHIDGNVRLREQWPAHIDFHFSHLDADPFLQSFLRNRVINHSAIAGDLTLEGPLRSPQQLNIVGNLSDLYAEAGKIRFRNNGPIRFTLSQRAFKLDNFHVVGENTDLSGSGSVQLSGDRVLDFEATGNIDLKLLQSYDPDITSSGSLVGESRITGTLDAPLVKGKLQVQNGAISDINLPSALSDINGTLLFSQNQVTIDSLSARVGGGTIAFTGRADVAGKLSSFELNAKADSVRLRYPPGVSSTADAQLNWSGSSSGSVLSGDITVTKLGFTPGFDFAAYLERTAQVSSLPQTDPVLNKIRLDIHLTTTPELQMQTSVIRLQGSADLRLRGSAAKPIMLGRADVFEGEAYFNGTKYRLERGGVSFTNPAVTTPFLDLEAVTRVRDYDVTLSLTGDISKPNGLKVNYRSDPPLPTADIIALLAFGQTTEESAQLQQTNQSAFSQQASSAMLAAALNATLNNRAQRLFGNSRIKIDPQGLESETSTITQSGPAVTIEQQVKDNLTVSYTTDVSQTSQQVIRAEYNLSKNVSIVAIRDQNGVVSFDVKIRRRKR
jgi:translocation and assembly module TamB